MADKYSQNVNTFTDYGVEQKSIERRRKMAELLQQQAMQPIANEPNAGGYVVPTSWTHGLAKLLQGGAAGYEDRKLDEESKALAARGRLENADWLKSLQGTAAIPATPESSFDAAATGGDFWDKGVTPATDAVPAAPLSKEQYMAKIMEGASSGNPMSSSIAGPMLAKMLEPNKFGHEVKWTRDGLPYLVGDKGEIQFLDPEKVSQPARIGTAAPGSMLYDENNPTGRPPQGVMPPASPQGIQQPQSAPTLPHKIGGIQPIGTVPRNDVKTIPENWSSQLPGGITRLPNDPPGVVRLAGSDKKQDLYQAEYENGKYVGLKKLDNAPNISLSASMPPQEKAFESKLGTEQADELVKGRKSADDAISVINTVNEGRKIMKSGMVTGFGANFIVSVGQALKQAGIDFGGDETANAQAYTANMAQNVGRIIKQFGSGTGLSDADRRYAEAMAGGQISLDKSALNKILDINEKQARWVISQHNARAKGIKSNIPLTVEMPPIEAEPSVPSGGWNDSKEKRLRELQRRQSGAN